MTFPSKPQRRLVAACDCLSNQEKTRSTVRDPPSSKCWILFLTTRLEINYPALDRMLTNLDDEVTDISGRVDYHLGTEHEPSMREVLKDFARRFMRLEKLVLEKLDKLAGKQLRESNEEDDEEEEGEQEQGIEVEPPQIPHFEDGKCSLIQTLRRFETAS